MLNQFNALKAVWGNQTLQLLLMTFLLITYLGLKYFQILNEIDLHYISYSMGS